MECVPPETELRVESSPLDNHPLENRRARVPAWVKRKAFFFKAMVLILLVVWPLAYHSGYATRTMTTGGLYAMLTIAVVVILGQAGQMSFAHSAFYGMGAYTSALLAMKASVPTLLALIIGAIVPGIIALIVGRPVLKLRYFYLALATIGLGQIFAVVVTQARTLTGSTTGLSPIPTLKIFGFDFNTNLRQYYLIWVIAAVVILSIDRALKYRLGRALRGIASSEIACSTLGVRTRNWKLLAFVTSAVICGLAGGLYAFITMAIAPNTFTFAAAILPVVMMLLGGGSVWGGVIGAIIMTWVVNGFTGIQQYAGVTYSIVMVLLLIFLPAGLALRPDQRARIKAVFMRERPAEPVECLLAAEADQRVGQCETSIGLPLAGSDPVAQDGNERSPGRVSTAPSSDGILLEVRDLTVRFGGINAVDRVSFKIPSGGIVALIGPNGAREDHLLQRDQPPPDVD